MKSNNYPTWLVPINIAKKLKEIGFNKSCYYKSDSDGVFFTDFTEATERGEFLANIYIDLKRGLGNLPTWEQVFEWFREKGYEQSIIFDTQMGYADSSNQNCYLEKCYHILIKKYSTFKGKYINVVEEEKKMSKFVGISCKTYEEARLKTVIKLIELYKNELK